MRRYLSLVKFSHTIFALPFALLGYFLAAHHLPEGFAWRTLGLVVLCMVFARSAAMAFNRLLDRHIDRANPRTAGREVPAGLISARSAGLFVAVNSLLFVACAYFINPLCFALSPVALLVILGYSYTKRFTFLCHFVLGLGLALAPLGAWLAVGGQFDLLPLLYAGAVLFWVAGFDIIYALQDEAFDRSQNLRSVPVWLGTERALWLSNFLHVGCAGFLLAAAYQLSRLFPAAGWLHWTGVVLFIGLLVYQHRLVRPGDLSRVDLAFFTTNGIASLLFGGLVILDLYI